MIEQLFTSLKNMAEQSDGFALAAAFLWGILSIVLSPCHLASIPLVVAYVNRGSSMSIRRGLGLSTLFAFGIFVSIVAIGVLTALSGRLLGDIGPWGNWIVAGVFLVFGLVMLDVISLPWSGADLSGSKQSGPLGALVLGLVFGIAVGPCTFAYMAPILAIVFEAASERFVYSAMLIVLYSVGHCGLIVLAGTLGARLQAFLNWNHKSQVTVRIRKVCGVLLLLAGLYMIYKI
jgi:cytochrome c-type biogenesis protein